MWFMAIGIPAVLIGADFYIAHRLHRGLRTRFPRMPFWAVLLVVALLGACVVFSFLGVAPRALFGYGMGTFIYLLLYTLLMDGVGCIARLCRAPFVRTTVYRVTAVLSVVVLAAVTVLGGALHANHLQMVSYEVAVDKATDVSDIRLVLISDLHLGAAGSEERLEDVVASINALSPDVVCIAGDFFDTDFATIRNPELARDTLRNLKATYGVYACLGNHDAGSTAPQMTAFMEDSDIHLLEDAYTLIDDRLYLVGRLDGSPIGGLGGKERQPLEAVLPPADDLRPVVVLDHNPAHIGEYTREVDLVLSGHTHQGQLFPANILTDLLYEEDYGYLEGNAARPPLIVTSGVGYWGMPLRIGTDCEIVSITLK